MNMHDKNQLKKYREFLILLYVSLRKKNVEAAVSLFPLLDFYMKEIKKEVPSPYENSGEPDPATQLLLKKIIWLQTKIIPLLERTIDEYLSNVLFRKQIHTLIQKFLLEKKVV